MNENGKSSWQALGNIISYPVHGAVTTPSGSVTNQGEGDCTMVPNPDGNLYAYCQKNPEGITFAARAPIKGTLGPGQWHNYYNGQWSQPSIGGEASSLGAIGTFASTIPGVANAVLLSADPINGVNGISISSSNDMVNFTTLPEPLIVYDNNNWNTPTANDLFGYPVFNNATDGSRTLDPHHFYFFYMFVPSDIETKNAYLNTLVMQDVYVDMGHPAPYPHVLSPLTRWVQANGVLHTSAAPEFASGSTFQAQIGYLMTAAPKGLSTKKLEECVKNPGAANADYLLSFDGTCTSHGYQRLRSVGWVYSSSHPNSLPLYSCLNAKGFHFGSSDSRCEGQGQPQMLLGYLIEN